MRTPGEWYYRGQAIVSEMTGQDIARVYHQQGMSADEVDENGWLLAAAPKMQDACAKALDAFRNMYDRLEAGADVDDLLADKSLWPLSDLRNALQ